MDQAPRQGGGQPASVREREHLDAMRREKMPTRGEPAMADLFARYAIPGTKDAGWLYRLVSGFAHGRPWALGTGRLTPVDAPSLPGSVVVSATASREGAELLARVSVRALSVALSELERFELVGRQGA